MLESPVPTIINYGSYVVAYAHTDDTVKFEQRKAISVGGKWLEKMPCIAICEDFKTAEITILYCNEKWEQVGIGGNQNSIEGAKQRIERSYNGIDKKWVAASWTKDEALAIQETEFKASCCAFCGKNEYDTEAMIGNDTQICNYCIDEFYKFIHSNFNLESLP